MHILHGAFMHRLDVVFFAYIKCCIHADIRCIRCCMSESINCLYVNKFDAVGIDPSVSVYCEHVLCFYFEHGSCAAFSICVTVTCSLWLVPCAF